MQKYKVKVQARAKKQLRKLSKGIKGSIETCMYALADNPRPHGYKKLENRPGYRIRKGDYRIVYDIHDHIITVTVIALGHRREIYSG